MIKILKLVNGKPKVVYINYYDESILVTNEIGNSGTGYTADHLTFTLPNSEVYNGTVNELKVNWNEAQLEPGIHFDYQNSISATYVTMYTAIPKGSRIRFQKESN